MLFISSRKSCTVHLGTLCVLSKIVLQRSLKQLPYWLATLSADSAISICCRSKITVTVQRLWQASSRKTNLSYPLRQPVIYTTTSEKRTPWSGGVIRSKDVSLHNISFVPPTNDLEKIIQNGFNFLQHEVANPVERAIGVFLFMARNQPFYDANKRTASLMMNGCLMVNGYFPITVLNQNSEEFHRELGCFTNPVTPTICSDFSKRQSKNSIRKNNTKAFPQTISKLSTDLKKLFQFFRSALL